MANPSNAKTLAGIRADRKRAEQKAKDKDRKDGAALRKKYKSKKKPK